VEKESDKILFLAAFTSIVGLMLLSYASESLEPPLMPIESVSIEHIEKNVHVSGEISSIKKFNDNSLSISLVKSSTEVYIPKNIAEKINFTKGSYLDLIGTVKMYNGKIEISVLNEKNIRIIPKQIPK